jgi:hypothetical protein
MGHSRYALSQERKVEIRPSWMTFKYGSHMSEQMKEILEMTSWPMVVKNAAPAALDATHGVEQEDEGSSQGNEVKTPFDELIVAGSPLVTTRADCDRTFARLIGTEAAVFVDKAPETMAAVQDRGQFHAWLGGE